MRAGELFSLPPNLKALRELGTVPPRELGAVPPLGGGRHVHTTKIGSFEDFGVKFWSQLVFLFFFFFSMRHLLGVLLFFRHPKTLFLKSLF